ncbi:hypothetical protein [Streptomyces agglomeratus]|uniref:hypothetical protein n=1 Tax=Streptomyces agglomeratus TaxID=285458 RepID=UPI00210CB645|nr:hypothetical protein [Streptomyces agglomeratus]
MTTPITPEDFDALLRDVLGENYQPPAQQDCILTFPSTRSAPPPNTPSPPPSTPSAPATPTPAPACGGSRATAPSS